MKTTDILLIARPDHSYITYQSLLKSELRFRYVTFKLFPLWIKKLLPVRKMRAVTKYYSLNWGLTIHEVLCSLFHRRIFDNKKEERVFGDFACRQLKEHNPIIVHYWPLYCKDAIRHYKRTHPETFTLAEIYFPNQRFVLETTSDILAQYGVDCNLNYIKDQLKIYEEVMEYEDNFLVPSKFVADSFRRYYPSKNFYVIPYGITISEKYMRKKPVDESHKFKFVYLGKISIEKGCDVLCQYFSTRPAYELHLFGTIVANEKKIFQSYCSCGNIIFHGAVPKNEVQTEMAFYDVGIHLSRFDAYSLAVGEIIGCGLPVIVSETTGISDDVIQNGWGLVTTLEEPAIDKAVRTITSKDVFNSFVESIDKYVMSSPQSYGERMVAFYKQILNSQNTKGL